MQGPGQAEIWPTVQELRGCAKKCPVDAITGSLKQPHVIDADKCIKCGACKAACKFGAIVGI